MTPQSSCCIGLGCPQHHPGATLRSECRFGLGGKEMTRSPNERFQNHCTVISLIKQPLGATTLDGPLECLVQTQFQWSANPTDTQAQLLCVSREEEDAAALTALTPRHSQCNTLQWARKLVTAAEDATSGRSIKLPHPRSACLQWPCATTFS